MINLSTLPTYNGNNLPDFIHQLRSLVFADSHKVVADYFYISRPRIVRYESYNTKDKPRIGYLAELARLIAEQVDNDPAIQTALLQKVNQVLINDYRKVKFKHWPDLCREAQTYLHNQRAKYEAKLAKKLDLPIDVELIGAEDNLQCLLNRVMEPDKNWLISIEGLGGLGKTALTAKLIRQAQLRHQFKQMAWVSAKQQDFLPVWIPVQENKGAIDINDLIDALLTQLIKKVPHTLSFDQKTNILKTHLKQTPCLIVIDNLETVSDYTALLPLLQSFVDPTKVVLTSRYSLRGYPNVFRLNLEDLNKAAAIALMRQEDKFQAMPLLAGVPDSALTAIYEIVGGNPLVLKLVVGQIADLDLPEVLESLKQVKDTPIEKFYAYIYEQAWHHLGTRERHVFLMMLLAQDSTTPHLMALTKLSRATLNQILRHLIRLSLIQVGGDVTQERHYRIHRLTETFLLKEKINWQRATSDIKSNDPMWNEGVLFNLQYWLDYLADEQARKEDDADNLDKIYYCIIRAISFGLDLEPALTLVYQLVFEFSDYMEKRGHWEIWSQILRHTLQVAKQNDDLAVEIKVLILLARLSYQQNRFKDCILYYRRVMRQARKAGDAINQARACSNLGYYYVEQGYLYRAKVLCCYALSTFERLDNDHGRAHTENHLGVFYIWQERWEQAHHHLERACEIWQKMGDGHGLMRGYINMAIFYIYIFQYDDALEYFEKAKTQATLNQDEIALARIYEGVGLVHTKLKSFEDGEACSKKALQIYQQFSHQAGLAQVWDNLGMNYLYQGYHKKAFSYLQQSLEAWRMLENKRGEIATLIDLVEYALYQQNDTQAQAYFDEASKLLSERDRSHYLYLQSRLSKHSLKLAK